MFVNIVALLKVFSPDSKKIFFFFPFYSGNATTGRYLNYLANKEVSYCAINHFISLSSTQIIY
jgi:hypothetical protein